jgi:predicted transcriptional regulator of viral defense system
MDDMAPDWTALFGVASGQSGYFTVAQARACGFSSALIAHHAKGGRLQHVAPRLYRISQYPSSPREEVMQAWLAAGPQAVVSHESALDLLGLSDTIPDRIHVTVPRAMRWLRARPDVVVHTVGSRLQPEEVWVREGIRVTSPVRTILDVAQVGGAPDQVVQAVRDGFERGLAGPQELVAGLTRRGKAVEDLIRIALEAVES